MNFFQQTLHPVVQLYAVPRQLVLAACHGAPKTLFRIRHKTHDQFLCYEPFYQAFGVRKIFLPSFAPTIGLGFQMQRSRHHSCTFLTLASRFPVALQRSPHRLPVIIWLLQQSPIGWG